MIFSITCECLFSQTSNSFFFSFQTSDELLKRPEFEISKVRVALTDIFKLCKFCFCEMSKIQNMVPLTGVFLVR